MSSTGAALKQPTPEPQAVSRLEHVLSHPLEFGDSDTEVCQPHVLYPVYLHLSLHALLSTA